MLSEFDNSRIGVDYAQAFRESNLVLMASMPSIVPGVLDGESLELERRTFMLFYGILMQGVPNYWPGILVIGGKAGEGQAWARRIVCPVERFHRHGHVAPFLVSLDSLRIAEAVVPGIKDVFSVVDYKRLRRGVNSLIAGWKAGSVLDRLHAFVRAFDGMMKLEQGAGEKQFAERIQAVATGHRLDAIAREIYRLRSYNEHLSDWPAKLSYVREPDRPEFVSRRAFQAEVLAGATYRTLLSEPGLRDQFTDAQVEGFWSGPHAWPSMIDVDAQTHRFRFAPEF